ncbi:two-component regulator propeller domain-containing protein [Sediminitomix flava]|nr:two-component regulator propeller domain-containing protein [Sediminitomix flava]
MKRLKTTIHLLLCIVLMSTLNTHAQRREKWHGDIYGALNGLNQQHVKATYQDKLGRIWIATSNGLNLFNGQEFKSIKREVGQEKTLSSNVITSFVEISDSRVLLGTHRGGINVLNPLTEEVYAIKSLPFKDKNETKDFQRFNMGFGFYDQTRNIVWLQGFKSIAKIYLDEHGTPEFYSEVNLSELLDGGQVHSLYDIYMDNEDDLWVVSSNGVFRLPRGTDKFKLAYQGKSLKITHLYQSKDGQIWIGTNKGIQLVTDKENFTFEAGSKKKSNTPSARNMLEYDGNLWVIFPLGNVGFFDISKREYIKIYDLSRNVKGIELFDLQKDQGGGIWVSSNRGIAYYHPHSPLFNTVTRSDQLGFSNQNLSYVFPTNNKIMVGHDLGMSIYDPFRRRIHNYTQKNSGLEGGLISEIIKGKNGQYWYATHNKGFGKIRYKSDNNVSFEQASPDFEKSNVLSHTTQKVKDITLDHNGYVWGATQNTGAFCFQPKENLVIPLTLKEGLMTQRTTVVEFDANKNQLWVGTRSQGVSRITLDENSKVVEIKHFKSNSEKKNHLGKEMVTNIFIDSKDRVWIATLGGGVYELINQETGEMKSYLREGVFSEKDIMGMTEDTYGHLWLAGNKAVFRMDIEKESVTSYKPFKNQEFMLIKPRGVIKDKNGIVYFASSHGLAYIDPSTLTVGYNKPEVKFNELFLKGKKVGVGKEIDGGVILKTVLNEVERLELEADQNDLGISFFDTYYQEDELNYQFMIEGYHDDWQSLESQRRIVYSTGLRHGDYKLKVRAKGRNEIWSDVAILDITIYPRWYENPINRAIGLLILILLSYLGVRWRMSALKEQKKELELQVEERTSEILEQKGEILAQNEELRQMNEEVEANRDHLEEKHQELEVSYADFNLVVEIGKLIVNKHQFDEIIKILKVELSQLVNYQELGIAIQEKRKDVIRYVQVEDGEEIDSMLSLTKDKSDSVVQCFSTNKEINQESKEKGFSLYIPLVSRAKSIGVLYLKSNFTKGFNAREIRVIKSMTSYLSSALENILAYRILFEQNKSIKESLRYAHSIQELMTQTSLHIQGFVSDHFIFSKPRDIVSGDFTWSYRKNDDTLFIASVDCTGHGVPGALLSMLGISILNKIVREQQLEEPSKILEALNENIRKSLKQENGHNTDGMDLSICVIQKSANMTYKVRFSGAKSSIYIVRRWQTECEQMKGSRKRIGGLAKKNKGEFETQELTLSIGDYLYLATDGFADQNSPKNEKYGTQRFMKLLGLLSNSTTNEQQVLIENELKHFMESQEQRDDITVIGLEM